MERTVSARLRTPIIKPLEEFLTFTDGEHGYNAETWGEALGNTGYLTPNDRFFIRSHTPPHRHRFRAWSVRWSFSWDARPGGHEIRVRSTDAVCNVQPNKVAWNDLGYLYSGVVGHPVEMLQEMSAGKEERL